MNYLKAFIFALICFANFSIYASDASVSTIFLKRHSGKSYDPSKKVTISQMKALMEAARWTPSSHNDQPWYFLFCERDLTPEAYNKVFSTLKDTQKAWVQNAPLLVVVIMRSKEIHNGKQNYWGDYDAGAAAISMALQAVDLDLMAHQVGGCDKAKLTELFALPENHKIMTVMVVGHELSAEPDLKAYPRIRRPIEETFFLGEWGAGFPQGLLDSESG